MSRPAARNGPCEALVGGESGPPDPCSGMRGNLRGFRVDRERAVKTAALIGLVVLGISTLPGLLRTPEPPAVPVDVGFRPGEMARFAAAPEPEKAAGRDRAERDRLKTRRREKREAERKAQRRLERVRKRRVSKEKGKRPDRKGRSRSSAEGRDGSNPGPDPGVGTSSASGSVPAPPPQPVYSPPADAPAPPPPPPPPSPPSDGSQEFAPR